jgi:hypothetical protein
VILVVGIYVLGVLLFVAAFVATRLTDSFGEVLRTAKSAIGVFRDPKLDDDAKELAARRASWVLLKQSAAITGKGALCVAGALLPFWAADQTGLKPWSETIEFAARLDVLGVTTAVTLGIWFAWRRRTASGS